MSAKFNLTQYCFENSAKKTPHKTAILEIYSAEESRPYSYADIYQQILNVAAGLRKMNHPQGSHVIIRSVKNVDFLILYFAVIAAGLVPIATMPELKELELQHIVDSAKPVIFMYSAGLTININLPQGCDSVDETIIAKLKKTDSINFTYNTFADDPAFTIFTSGSSGPAKGVVHAHRNVQGREPIRKYWSTINANDTVLVTGKPCWTYSMGVGFFDTFAENATALLYEAEVEDNTWFHLIEKYRVSILASSPLYYKKMVHLTQDRTYDLSSLRRMLSAGEELPQPIYDYFFTHFGQRIYQALGMTECPTFISSGEHAPPKPNSLGKIQPGRKISVRDLEDINHPAAENAIGKLAVHTNECAFMLGYLDPHSGRPIPMQETWFDTADRVSQDNEGYLYYVTRGDDILNLNSARIAPHEIESVLLTLDGIIDTACAVKHYPDKPDELWAFVVVENQKKLTEVAIIQYVAQRLSARRTPVRIIFLDSLPKNVNGKLARHEVESLIEKLK